MRYVTGLVVLEGPDGGGKTTLARELVERYNAYYIHLRWSPTIDIWKYQTAALRLAQKLVPHRLIVIDRHWISECIYGKAYRQRAVFEEFASARCLDRVVRKLGGVYVLCMPSTSEVVEHHRKLKGEREEMYDDVQEVATRYEDLWSGSIVRPIHGDYVEQLSAIGGVSKHPNWIRYNWMHHTTPKKLFNFAKLVRHSIVMNYQPLMITAGFNFAGSMLNAKCALVGETPSRVGRGVAPWPWYSKRASGASTLNVALHSQVVDDQKLCFFNSEPWPNTGPTLSQLRDVVPSKFPIIALGHLAHERSVRAGFKNVTVALHPQFARRFLQKSLAAWEAQLEAMITREINDAIAIDPNSR